MNPARGAAEMRAPGGAQTRSNPPPSSRCPARGGERGADIGEATGTPMGHGNRTKAPGRRRADRVEEYEHLVYDVLIEQAIEKGTAVPRIAPCTPECAVCNTPHRGDSQ